MKIVTFYVWSCSCHNWAKKSKKNIIPGMNECHHREWGQHSTVDLIQAKTKGVKNWFLGLVPPNVALSMQKGCLFGVPSQWYQVLSSWLGWSVLARLLLFVYFMLYDIVIRFVICYAVWSLQMWSHHCLSWSEPPPPPLTKVVVVVVVVVPSQKLHKSSRSQNNECDPILHGADATSRKTWFKNLNKYKYKNI